MTGEGNEGVRGRRNTGGPNAKFGPDTKSQDQAGMHHWTGIAVAAATSLITIAVALPWLSSRDVNAFSYGDQVILAIVGALAATAIGGLGGVGVGVLLPNQTLAVTITLIWTLMLEGLLVGFAPEVARWLPGGAANALTGTPTEHGGMLPMWAGACVLTGYGLAFAGAGARIIERRDIT